MILLIVALLLASADGALAASPAGQAEGLYQERCASCHGARRYGGYAPPLIPQTLARKDDAALSQAIRAGLPNTQMGGFGHEVGEEQARSLVDLLREPVGEIRWSAADVAASRSVLPRSAPKLGPEIVRARLILVVERGSGSVSVLDGDSLRELDRFPVGALHGGIKFDRRLRRAYAATRDGTLVEYDLVRGGLAARVKVGVNTRNIAVAPDGSLVAAANQLPAGLVLLDGSLGAPSLVPLPAQPSAVYAVPGRPRFVVGLRGLAQLLLVEYADRSVQRLEVPEPFEDFVFVPGTRQVVASARAGSRLLLYDLESRRVLGALAVEGLPHLFSACFFERHGVPLAAFNHVGVPRLRSCGSCRCSGPASSRAPIPEAPTSGWTPTPRRSSCWTSRASTSWRLR
jgi:mono/diheme cytochrome c family protein